MIGWPMKVLKTCESPVLYCFIHELAIAIRDENTDHFVYCSSIPEAHP